MQSNHHYVPLPTLDSTNVVEEKSSRPPIKVPSALRLQHFSAIAYYKTQIEEEQRLMRRIGKDKNKAISEVERLKDILEGKVESTIRALRNLADENYSRNSTSTILNLTTDSKEGQSTLQKLYALAQSKLEELSADYANHLAERNAHREQIKFHQQSIIALNKIILFPHMGEVGDSLGYPPPSMTL
jgi:hypothetical protein